MQGAKARRRPRLSVRLAWVWFVVVSIVLLWQKSTYWGLYAFAAEWQFNAFGSYRPALTYLFLIVILCLPLLLISSRRSRELRSERASLPRGSQLDSMIRAKSRWAKALFCAAIAVAVAALAIALSTALLPSAGGPVSRMVLTAEMGAPPPLGPVVLSGRLLSEKTAVFDEDFLVLHRSSRFAPMVAEGADQTMLRYFVELPVDTPIASNDAKGERKGILRRGGLPGELVRLYRYAGFRVDPNYYVLFSSPEAMRRAELTEAVELLIFAVFLGLIGAIFAFRHRQLVKRASASPLEPETS